MEAFRIYNPHDYGGRPHLRACEACHTRKVRCNHQDGERPCQNCHSQGLECQPRTRKRKSNSNGEHGRTNCGPGVPDGGPPIPESSRSTRSRVDSLLDTTSSLSQFNDPIQDTQPDDRRARQLCQLSAPLLFIRSQANRAPLATGRAADRGRASVDAFRNLSFISRSAILGEDFPDIDHSHEGQGRIEHRVSSRELEVLRLYRAFDLPEPPERQSLLDACMEYCWTWMPVVDISATMDLVSAKHGSLLVLQTLLLVGSLMRFESCTKQESDEYYQRVKAIINATYEDDPLNVLAALCLVQWYTPSAPKDISTDTPRFWETYALGLAHQMGLHRAASKRSANDGLRRRIWWTLSTRDNLMAAAHGRPRMLNPADFSLGTPCIQDFEDPLDDRAQIFVSYVGIVSILGDLCQLLTRDEGATAQDRTQIALRLRDYLHTLPETLRLIHPDGSPRAYNFDISQLHVPILTTVIILHRPRSVFSISAENAASVVAAHLVFRIFQAIELREQTRFLSSAFAWYLLVASIPYLSCLKIRHLRAQSNAALDVLEGVLATLGRVRPSAANNLRNVRTFREAVRARGYSRQENGTISDEMQNREFEQAVSSAELFRAYGSEAVDSFHRTVEVLAEIERSPLHASPPTVNETPPIPAHANIAQPFPLTTQDDLQFGSSRGDLQSAFDDLFGDDLQDNVWMRDWIDDLQLAPG